MQYPCGWVSPFGHRRIKACCQLPDAFRRLPRPSSPLTAKASTVCACSLDHITPSRLGAPRVLRTVRLITSIRMAHAIPPQPHDTFEHLSNARYFPDCQRTSARLNAGRFQMDVRRSSRVSSCGLWPGTTAFFRGKARWREVDPRPMSAAATQHREKVVGLGGLEPPASPLSGVRSNHLSYRPNVVASVVEPVGIEPTTPCLQSRCSPS